MADRPERLEIFFPEPAHAMQQRAESAIEAGGQYSCGVRPVRGEIWGISESEMLRSCKICKPVLIFQGRHAIIYKILNAVMEIEAQRVKSNFRYAGSSQDLPDMKGAVAEGARGESVPGRRENISSTVALCGALFYTLSGEHVSAFGKGILIAGTPGIFICRYGMAAASRRLFFCWRDGFSGSDYE